MNHKTEELLINDLMPDHWMYFTNSPKQLFGLLDCLLDRTHSLHHSEKQKRNPSRIFFFIYIQDTENATPAQMKTALFIQKTTESYK